MGTLAVTTECIKKSVPFLVCSEEFTCDDGQCVKLLQACDDRSDCADGSDESLVRCAISRTFRGGHPNNSSRPPRRQTELSLHVKRFNIVSIDEAAMVVTVSMSFDTLFLPFGLDICEFKLMIRNAGTETPVFSGSVSERWWYSVGNF
ncbi:hypothetical protein HAZT_HAZT011986 [Hyalella azteca]|uniref:Low-density lipoprotein receptor domain class A n=1 Tax=Hyalella azteca TaxID=294128 RepID=A0A6A0H171_HYAAZ|nr:hypothetical protein HAZT_HAZT011986 [Hyalella azteca]